MLEERNPFICGAPVPPSHFVGRKRELKAIFDQLASPASRSISVVGANRIGKTSLLQYIASNHVAETCGLNHNRCVILYLDCQSLGSSPAGRFWYRTFELLMHEEYDDELNKRAGRIRETPTITHSHVEQFLRWLKKQGQRLILALDEFEWMLGADIDDEVTMTREFLPSMRALLSRHGRELSLITATARLLEEECRSIEFKGSPFYDLLTPPVNLRPFDKSEAWELIDKALKGSKVRFREDDRNFVYNISGGFPHWLQSACFELFRRYTELDGERLPGSVYEEIAAELETLRREAALESVRPMVFISSTWVDLQNERAAVERALKRMHNTEFIGMEYFGSQPDRPKKVCMELVSRSHFYVGIFAYRYGSVDPETGLSMTELEYRKARECKIPCLIYVKDKNAPVFIDHIERNPEKRVKLATLTEEMLSEHAVSFFTSPEDLAWQVVTDLHNLLGKKVQHAEQALLYHLAA